MNEFVKLNDSYYPIVEVVINTGLTKEQIREKFIVINLQTT